MSLNDVCVYVPVWFGVVATVFWGCLQANVPIVQCWHRRCFYRCNYSRAIMRSVGSYDNESVAMTAMMMTFYCWVRSLRRQKLEKRRSDLGLVCLWNTMWPVIHFYGYYVGRVHLRLEPNCSTRCCFGLAWPLFQQIASRVLSVLYYWDNWSDSCPGCWVGTVKIYGTVVGPCCVLRVPNFRVL